jgi:hypothetical protein
MKRLLSLFFVALITVVVCIGIVQVKSALAIPLCDLPGYCTGCPSNKSCHCPPNGSPTVTCAQWCEGVCDP